MSSTDLRLCTWTLSSRKHSIVGEGVGGRGGFDRVFACGRSSAQKDFAAMRPLRSVVTRRRGKRLRCRPATMAVGHRYGNHSAPAAAVAQAESFRTGTAHRRGGDQRSPSSTDHRREQTAASPATDVKETKAIGVRRRLSVRTPLARNSLIGSFASARPTSRPPTISFKAFIMS